MTETNSPGMDPPDPEVFDHFSGATPEVADADRPWGFFIGLGGIGVLALVVFFSLSHARSVGAQALNTPPPPPPPVDSGAASSARAAVTPQPTPAPPPPGGLAPPGPDPSYPLHAPALVVDLSQAQQTNTGQDVQVVEAPGSTQTSAVAGGAHGDTKLSSDDQFAERVEGAQVETAYATHLRDTALIAPQGTLISAILETGINSDLPGFVRAVVSRDVHGFDGSTVLIPRGSKLIGEYHNGVAAGQSRAFVVWSRVLTPDGISINLGSPAADKLGQAGLAGETNSHFLRRFGSAILLSVLDAGLQVATNDAGAGNSTSIVIGSSQQATSVAGIALQKDIDIPVTITVPQGTPLRVFVARDLDFSGVVHRQQ